SRLGLAAQAARIGGMRTIENRIDAAADLRERLVHLVVDGNKHPHVEEASAEPGLIGGYDDAVTRMVESCNRLEASRNGPPFVRRLDEVLAVVIDHAIAIEHDELR